MAGALEHFAVRLAVHSRCWANRLFKLCLGNRSRPVFFDVDRTYPALRVLEEHHDEIRRELIAILPEKHRIPLYHEVDSAQVGISANDDKAWRVLFLHIWRQDDRLPNRDLCPRTVAALDSIPGLLGAFFSILEPGKSVPPHHGPYVGYLRYHLPLVVPENKPPSIRVKDQVRTWRERESFFFDDSWEHEVYNDSDGVRVVLIADVFRPMPWPLNWINRAVSWWGTTGLCTRSGFGHLKLA